jgi:membrane-associated HD superfamily phosphohydrolase
MTPKNMPMITKYTFVLLFLATLLIACTNTEECKECEEEQNLVESPAEVTDRVANEKVIQEEEETIASDENVDQNFIANKEKIVQKFGKQWSFCSCVRANDSLDKLIKSGAELNDAFMKRFDEVDNKCKAFLVMSNNSTPEEREAHVKKTKDCIKAGKPSAKTIPTNQ